MEAVVVRPAEDAKSNSHATTAKFFFGLRRRRTPIFCLLSVLVLCLWWCVVLSASDLSGGTSRVKRRGRRREEEEWLEMTDMDPEEKNKTSEPAEALSILHKSALSTQAFFQQFARQHTQVTSLEQALRKVRESPMTAIETEPLTASELPSFQAPGDEMLCLMDLEQRRPTRHLVFFLVIDGGSSKTASSLWVTTVTTVTDGPSQYDWAGVRFYKELIKAPNLRDFLLQTETEVKESGRADLYLEKTAKFLHPLLQTAIKEISEAMQTFDPHRVSRDIPVVLHSTAGLRDVNSSRRSLLFQMLRRVINGSGRFSVSGEGPDEVEIDERGFRVGTVISAQAKQLVDLEDTMEEGDQLPAADIEPDPVPQMVDISRLGFGDDDFDDGEKMISGWYETRDMSGDRWKRLGETGPYVGVGRIDPPSLTQFYVLDKNTGQEIGEFRFFTTVRLCRAISGTDEAVYTFLTANIANGAIQAMGYNYPSGKRFLTGIVEVGGASLQIVFPTFHKDRPATVEFIDLSKGGRYVPRSFFPDWDRPLEVLAMSYMNLGINRAGDILLRTYCQQVLLEEDIYGYNLKKNLTDIYPIPNVKGDYNICYYPCYQSGWRQTGHSGVPRLTKDPVTGKAVFIVDKDGRVVIDGASIMSPVVGRKYAPDALTRKQCHEVYGTGDAYACAVIINDILFERELPDNREAWTDQGASALSEVTDFQPESGRVHVVGNSLTFPIISLMSWGFFDPVYYQSKKTKEIRQCDGTNLHRGAINFCATPLERPNFALVTPKNKVVHLTQFDWDYCFKAAYAYSLLAILDLMPPRVQVQFSRKIKNINSGEDLDFGWLYGAIATRTMAAEKAVFLRMLGSDYYRRSISLVTEAG